MSFSPVQIIFLQKLVANRPESRRAGEAALFFQQNFSIGRLVKNNVQYQGGHFQAALQLLQANDLPVTALGPNSTRADSAAFGGMSEKSLSAAPHSRSVAVKALGHCTLDGHELYTPAGAYLVLTPADAKRVVCQRLMVVENLETFRTLDAYAWIDRRGMDVLAIYRGDVRLRNNDATEAIQGRQEPIWGFFDFDPAGLAFANALPAGRLERVILPSQTWLYQAADTPRGRQLFDSQVAVYSNVLNDSVHAEVIACWQLMKRLRSGVTQERMVWADGC